MRRNLSSYKSQPIDWRAAVFGTAAPPWSVLVRVLVGLVVFLPEGIQKLAFPDILGAGRFAAIGIPYPALTGPFVGVVETLCGALIVLGLFTRLAAIPLIVIMIVAIVSTSCRLSWVRMSGSSTCPVSRATASGA